jgi:hypothetical protein
MTAARRRPNADGHEHSTPVSQAAQDISWEKTGIRFKRPEWPAVTVNIKSANVEASIPEGVNELEGGRFVTKRAKKARPARASLDPEDEKG